jgi:type II secretory pathway pseudopilin PulG
VRKNRGISTIEVLIAGAMVAFLAVAMLPASFQLVDQSKVSSFQSVCAGYARAKLQEYMSGVLTGSAGITSGFDYAKNRFQTVGGACTVLPTAGAPGFRERIVGNATGVTGQEPNMPSHLKGLQAWVNIRHYNPRVLSTGGQPTRQCPGNTYQFFRQGDGLEVTVTVMIRVRPTTAAGGRDGQRFGDLDDTDGSTPNPRLVCSASQLVFPPRAPFRYYLGSDGKVRNFQATTNFVNNVSASSDQALESHFRNVWVSQPDTNSLSTSRPLGSIRSISISPNNDSVWILRPGVLTQFKSCSDQTVTVDSIAMAGTPNCSLATGDIQHWQTDPNMDAITVDFKAFTSLSDDVIYGIYGTGSGGDLSQVASTIPVRTVAMSGFQASAAVTWSDAGALNLPASRPRIRTIFLTQTFPAVSAPNLFFADNTCYTPGTTGVSSWVYCVTLFNSGFFNTGVSGEAEDVRELPVQVEGISN